MITRRGKDRIRKTIRICIHTDSFSVYVCTLSVPAVQGGRRQSLNIGHAKRCHSFSWCCCALVLLFGVVGGDVVVVVVVVVVPVVGTPLSHPHTAGTHVI